MTTAALTTTNLEPDATEAMTTLDPQRQQQLLAEIQAMVEAEQARHVGLVNAMESSAASGWVQQRNGNGEAGTPPKKRYDDSAHETDPNCKPRRHAATMPCGRLRTQRHRTGAGAALLPCAVQLSHHSSSSSSSSARPSRARSRSASRRSRCASCHAMSSRC